MSTSPLAGHLSVLSRVDPTITSPDPTIHQAGHAPADVGMRIRASYCPKPNGIERCVRIDEDV